MSLLPGILVAANEIDHQFKKLQSIADTCYYEQDKHRVVFETKKETCAYLRLPINFFWDTTHNSTAHTTHKNYLIIIIESGSAALAYCENDQIIEHKMVKAYMVRKKQGKSQIKHLKTKGKSKAGSRVRLANTEHFFEEIQEMITVWLNYLDIETIALSCSKTLSPYLFTDSFLLDRKDKRILKIPRHIPEVNFENLLEVHQFLIAGELRFTELFTGR